MIYKYEVEDEAGFRKFMHDVGQLDKEIIDFLNTKDPTLVYPAMVMSLFNVCLTLIDGDPKKLREILEDAKEGLDALEEGAMEGWDGLKRNAH
jgi:hypothetical protein